MSKFIRIASHDNDIILNLDKVEVISRRDNEVNFYGDDSKVLYSLLHDSADDARNAFDKLISQLNDSGKSNS